MSSDQLEKREENNTDITDVLEDQSIQMEQSVNETNESLGSTNSQIEQQSISVISDDYIKAMLKEFQISLPKKWKDMSENDFRDIFISAEKKQTFSEKRINIVLVNCAANPQEKHHQKSNVVVKGTNGKSYVRANWVWIEGKTVK